MVNSRSYLEISTFTWIEIFTRMLGHNATDSHSSCLTNSIFTISRFCRAEGCAKGTRISFQKGKTSVIQPNLQNLIFLFSELSTNSANLTERLCS
jgi:hypothetical protein